LRALKGEGRSAAPGWGDRRTREQPNKNNPVIAGQDGAATDVEVGEPLVIDDTAEVEVTFRNFEPRTLYYTLVREHGGWKVEDIAHQQGEYPWSLCALFDGAGR